MTAATAGRRAWSTAAFVIRYEIGMWVSLYRWVFRRPRKLPAGARSFGYAGLVRPVMIAFIVVSAIEIPIAHLILPWPAVRSVVLFLGVYGLLWMIGFMASLRVNPHVVEEGGLRIRNGVTTDFLIPWSAIEAVRASTRTVHGRSTQVEHAGSAAVLHLAIANQTNVDVIFREPTVVPVKKTGGEPVTELRFAVEDGQALATWAQRQLTGRLSRAD